MSKAAKVREIPVSLPHPALPGADWGDCFETRVDGSGLTPERAAREAFERMPGWVDALMALRNLMVRPFGLKGDPAAVAAGAPRVGMFPVISRTDAEIVLGLDDRHLDFRIVVQTEASGDRHTTVRMMTLIMRHNLLGRAYLAAIMPFHKLIVARTLSRLG
ncbi:DUF2867 domain-containing protein [Hoeflea sp. YIM 152468]|uniref:DUF2867 domain-containing protein n=1 Tax=Hoeflea sp. YIM 152468 TaxID=3031759 RepID=UPI0023DBF69F|nr:DUF2867 domain-containing protein [Hoeflea sp. YIM 152468]MDF1610078.1 DUF2867 domain-containing protein [Hoeflea sp. YIM 152468]